ncbi:hypothetical protein [Streptomyces sp. NPDC060194]|uniref:hypothetical protein n=1 Tax=Streptomyces sp. NPDC060194 TaxID=3347069 RepID=UPI003665509B
MARPYAPAPRRFVFTTADGTAEEVSVADPQEAYEAFAAFFGGRESGTCTIADGSTGQSLALMPEQRAIARRGGADRPRTEYLRIDRGNRYLTSTMLFFENGHAGLDHFGQWFPDLTDLDAPPAARGAARAAVFTTEAAALQEVARIWADSGIVDPSDRYYVFFDAYDADEEEAERAELLALIAFLGLERADAPADAAGGEVWVHTDARLAAACERWS